MIIPWKQNVPYLRGIADIMLRYCIMNRMWYQLMMICGLKCKFVVDGKAGRIIFLGLEEIISGTLVSHSLAHFLHWQ